VTIKAGEWARVRREFGSLPFRVRAAMDRALREEAHALRRDVVKGIASQAPGGQTFAPLSPFTLGVRALRGFRGTKALIDRGDLRASVTTEIRGDVAFVGVSRTAKSKGGRALFASRLPGSRPCC
jgi:hypothetical protein